ncbi:MAG: autotransporter domain-containing protein, partial [Verrucomicrobiota bacterium]
GTVSPTGTVIINVGNFDISNITASSQTIGELIGGGNILLGEKTLITAAENDTSYVGIINGTGSFIKQGSGTLTLSGANVYSGGTMINAGTLALSGSGKLSSTGSVTIHAGIFDISNITDSFQTIGDLSGIGGEVILGDKTLIQDTSNHTSYAGAIRGSGAFIKQGLGTLILTGHNNYSGGTTVNAGVLQGNTNSLQGNILSDAQLVFDQISSGTYEGIISGGGSLIKQGPGMITILSDCSCFSGTVSIQEGTLMMKGKIGGGLEISTNAMLAGIGSVENVINHGIVKPGSSIGTLTINGNYTQGSSGILNIEIDELEASSLLQVTGAATLNGVLQVSPDPGVYLEGTTYTFLTAGSVIGQFSSTFSTRPLNYTINYFPTQAQLLILVSSLILPARPNGNAGAVVDYLFCSSFDFTDADLVTVTEALLELPINQYAQALNRLTPSQFGALALNELENNFSVANIFLGANQTTCCYNFCESTNLWINPLGLVYSQKNRLQLGQEAIGFTNHTYGVAAGIDHLFSNDWTLGFGLCYSYSHLHWKNQAGKARADSGYLGPYIGYDCGSFYFDFLILGTGNFYDVDRKVVFPGISRVASSHPTTWDLSEIVLAGFKLEPFYHFFVQPEFLIDQLNIFQESFHESGSGSIDLSVKRKYASFLRSLINLKFVKEWVFCNMCLAPSVNVGWLRTTPLTGRHYTASFREETFCSPNFSVTSFNQVIDQALVGVQILLSSQGGFSMSLGYEGRFGNGSKVNEIDIALDWRF